MDIAFFAYTALANMVTSIALGTILLLYYYRSAAIRRFFFFCLSIAYASTFYFLWLKTETAEAALYFARHFTIGMVLIPATYIAFVMAFLKIPARTEKIVNSVNLAVVILYLPFSFHPMVIQSVESKMLFPFWPEPGLLFHFGFSYFLMTTVYAHYLLWTGMQKEQGIRRRQIRYVLAGTVIGFVGGVTNFLLWYDIPVLPYFNLCISLFLLSIAYAVIRFRLLDIEIILRKTLVFAGLVSFVFAIFAAATFIIREILNIYLGISPIWSYIISIFLIVVGFDPIRNLLVDITDKHLFQKKYDYQKLLKDASKGISRIESLQHLFALVTHFITMRMRVVSAAILTKQKDSGRFSLEFQRGYPKKYLAYYVAANDPLIQYLSTEKEAIDLEKIREYMEAGGKKKVKGEKPHEYDFAGIRRQMEALESVCCVPSFLGHELKNVLVLGPKKSGDVYTSEDMNVLFTLAQESAIAIENARLYDEALSRTQELENINIALESAKGKLTQALNETEAANKQLQDTQAQLIHEQKMATLGRLAASVGHEVNNPLTILSMNVSRAILKFRKNPDLKVSEILEVFQKMEQNISRIKAVVNTLTGLLKKSEKGKFEPLSLKLILEETLPLVQFQTYLDNLTGTEVEFNVPGNVPLIRGDLERLQEVFLNLFINAYHAMAGRRNPRIEVKAEVDPNQPRMVAIHFTDNGQGMSEETQKRIFNYGFTTKPPGKGSGLGLYMCKYIIELHGGEINVRSNPGVGTTFTLTLPIYEEASFGNLSAQSNVNVRDVAQ